MPNGSDAPELVTAATAGTGAAFSGAVAACCTGPALGPLLVALLGAGGAAWAASLKPWSPLLLAGALGLLVVAFVRVGRSGCRTGGWVKATLGLSAIVWLGSAALVAWSW